MKFNPMRKALIFVFTLACCLLMAQGEPLSTQQKTELQSKAKAYAEQTKTLRSDFVQFKHMEFLANDIKTEGKLFFKTPNSIKWQYTTPFEYTVIFDKGKMLINDGGNKSQIDLASSELFKELNQLIVNSVNGNMFDPSKFTMSYQTHKLGYEVEFTPIESKVSELISSFVLVFSKDDASVLSVQMMEPSGDHTLIKFSERQLNVVLSDEVFAD